MLDKAISLLKDGQPVIFPTDTVWGIGVAVDYCESPQALFEVKGRDAQKPIAWLVGAQSDLKKYGINVPDYAFELADRYWPGALTLIVDASDAVAPAFKSMQGTIGLRMPNSPDALALIEGAESPLATTSANIASRPATPSTDPLDPSFLQTARKHSLSIFDPLQTGTGSFRRSTSKTTPSPNGGCPGQSVSALRNNPVPNWRESSTVVDCTGVQPLVLRQGACNI